MSRESKAVAFRRDTNKNREIRVAKYSVAREVIGEIKKGSDLFILTFGQFSLIDAMRVILQQVGKARVCVSTWTATDSHMRELHEMLQEAKISDCRFVVDHSFEKRQPLYWAKMCELFGPGAIRTIRVHSKFMVVRGASYDVLIGGSMNLNENPRLEHMEIIENRKLAEFMEGVVDGIFEEVGVDERRSTTLDLVNVPESYPFRMVAAGKLDNERLQEPSYSHTIKKL